MLFMLVVLTILSVVAAAMDATTLCMAPVFVLVTVVRVVRTLVW